MTRRVGLTQNTKYHIADSDAKEHNGQLGVVVSPFYYLDHKWTHKYQHLLIIHSLVF